MPKTKTEPTRSRGRPPVRIMPELIPDTPENVVRAISQGPPKPAGEWNFMKSDGAGYARPRAAVTPAHAIEDPDA